MIKKFLVTLMAVMVVGIMTACGTDKGVKKAEFTGTQLSEMISSVRDDEMNEFMPIYTSDDAEQNTMLLDFMGLNTEDIKSYAFSTTPINIKAYGIAVIIPGEGKEEAVLKTVNGFVEGIQKSFELYLPDQYAISKSAIVKVQENGAVVMVMCEDSQKAYDGIIEKLNAKA